MSLNAVIEISVSIYVVSKKKNNIISVWLLAVNMLLMVQGVLQLVT